MRIVSLPVSLLVLLTAGSCAIVTVEPEHRTTEERINSFPSGNLPVRKPVTIYWDSHMIPFIEAKDDRDLAFSLGLVHAHLRLAQIEFLKRVAYGRLSEIAGPFAVDIDHSLRILNPGQQVEQMLEDLPKENRVWLSEFVRGLNYYVQQLEEFPPDMRAMNIQSETWTEKDILTIGRLASADVNWIFWFSLLELKKSPRWNAIRTILFRTGADSIPSFDRNEISGLIAGYSKSGSNSIAVSSRRSAKGSSIIANDPHLGLSIPNFWLIAGYQSPGYHVVGLMIPGLPFVALGRNENISFGGTNMRSSSSDVYDVSTLDPSGFTTRKEKIQVRWWFDHEVTIRESRSGPIVSDSPLIDSGSRTLALQWMGHKPSDELSSFLKMNRAKNFDEFRNAFETYAVSGQNFLYADQRGNIGQILAVRMPLRKKSGSDDSFILDGSNPSDRWSSSIPSTKMPYAYNPKKGFLVSANNVPVKTDPPVGRSFSANDRVIRLTQLIEELSPLDMQSIRTIQSDVYSVSSDQLNQYWNKLIESHPELALERTGAHQSFLKSLEEWDGHYTKDSKGALAFQLVAYHLNHLLFSESFGAEFTEYVRRSDHAPAILLEWLEQLPLEEQKKVVRAALEKSSRSFHEFRSWGDMHHLRLEHNLGRIPFFGKSFQFVDEPVAGSGTTIRKTAHALTDERHSAFYGANSRHVSFMDDLDENYFVLLGGQDGWMIGENSLDQVELWKKNGYIRVPLRLKTVKKTFQKKTILNPSDDREF